MPKVNRNKIYIQMAEVYSQLSYAERLKVGCIVTKENRVVSMGYNGTPKGTDNRCEDETGKTKGEVIHAEMNALIWAAQNHINLTGCNIYITASPCLECAKYIKQFGIKQVFYLNEYRDNNGIIYLNDNDIPCQKINL